MAAPAQFHNMRKLVEGLSELGYRRIGMWLPKSFDDRASGQHTGGFWRAQRAIPRAGRVPIGFPDEWDRSHFLAWLDKNQPDVLIGLRDPLNDWMKESGRPLIPVAWCGDSLNRRQRQARGELMDAGAVEQA
jgi:hypothetical protein